MPGPWEKFQKPVQASQATTGAPWQKYAARPADTTTTTPKPAATQPAEDLGPLDELAQWGAKTFSHITPEAEHTDAESFGGPFFTEGIDRHLSNAGGTMMRDLTAIPAGLVDSVKHGFTSDAWTLGGAGRDMQKDIEAAKQNGTLHVLQPGEAPPTPTLEQLGDYATDAAGHLGAGMLVGEAGGGLLKAPGALKNFVRGDVDAPIVGGSGMTARQRYLSGKKLGVNFDAADATNSPLLTGVKRVGEDSLAGGHFYDHLKASNTGAFNDSMDRFLNELYPGDRESGGREIQDALRMNHEGLRTGAEQGFDQLTEATKGQPVAGAPAVGSAARTLLKPISDLAEQYPSLAPGKTMSVLKDLGRVGALPDTHATGFLDAPGSEFAVHQDPAEPTPVTWSDLQRLRSGTHDLTTTNPDLVKSQAIAPLQRMTSAIDDAMTNSESGLTPAQTKIFRDANASWRDMKETYDDTSSSYHHALRKSDPSLLFQGVGSRTPENARDLLGRLTHPDLFMNAEPSPAVGAVRRGTVESALKPTAGDLPNYGSFGLHLNRIPADYRAELFNLDQNRTLQDFGRTSNVIGKDFNPSGSGKKLQKVGEAAELGTSAVPALLGHPAALAASALYNAGQYGISKAMTSPRVVDWLMKPSALPPPMIKRLAVAASASRHNSR